VPNGSRYTEDQLVERPANGLFAGFGWQAVFTVQSEVWHNSPP